MSAKKTTTKQAKKEVTLTQVTITMGMYKGRQAFLTKKKAPDGYAVVNIIEGPEIMINKNFYK